ncbi:hypothetical protein ACFO1B_12065, partial [Dactylosporangium siamense]
NYNQPSSAPPANYSQPSSAPPNYNQPMSGPPANYNQPMSGPPANYGGPPVSAPPNRAAGQIFRSSGGVPVSPAPPVEPATRYDEFGSPVRQGGAQQRPTYQQPAQGGPGQGRPTQRGDERRPGGGTRRRGPFARVMLTLLVLVLLIATPVAAGYVSFYLTADHWPPAPSTWFDSKPR